MKKILILFILLNSCAVSNSKQYLNTNQITSCKENFPSKINLKFENKDVIVNGIRLFGVPQNSEFGVWKREIGKNINAYLQLFNYNNKINGIFVIDYGSCFDKIYLNGVRRGDVK